MPCIQAAIRASRNVSSSGLSQAILPTSVICPSLLGLVDLLTPVRGRAGITRDPVTVNVAFKDKALDLTDSAGLRRKLKQFKSADPIDIAVSEVLTRTYQRANAAAVRHTDY